MKAVEEAILEVIRRHPNVREGASWLWCRVLAGKGPPSRPLATPPRPKAYVSFHRCFQGITDDILAKELPPNLSTNDRAAAINKLLNSKRLQLFEQQTGSTRQIAYKEVTAEEAAK